MTVTPSFLSHLVYKKPYHFQRYFFICKFIQQLKSISFSSGSPASSPSSSSTTIWLVTVVMPLPTRLTLLFEALAQHKDVMWSVIFGQNILGSRYSLLKFCQVIATQPILWVKVDEIAA